MSNRRRQQTKYIKNIDAYNKFLGTLDQITSSDLSGNAVENSKDSIKNEIDKLIMMNDNVFNSNKYSSKHFTGETPSDKNYTKQNDPNHYKDIFGQNFFFMYAPTKNQIIHTLLEPPPSVISTPKKRENTPIVKPIEILKNVNIETEINTITDILDIINKYPLDPSIKYNININSVAYSIIKTRNKIKNQLKIKTNEK